MESPRERGAVGNSYFVCATPRTGSSLLLGLLHSTGVAGHPQAYFRSPDERLWAKRWRVRRTPEGDIDYGDYVRAALAAGRTDNGVFGAKLMWGNLDELVDKLGSVCRQLAGDELALLAAAFGRTRFVYLRRDDIVAQAVSWLRAEQTGTWYVGGNGEIGPGAVGTGGRPRFNAQAIADLVRVIHEHNVAWQEWFASHGIRPHVMRYEDLDGDSARATAQVLQSLGLELPPGRPLSPVTRHARQADALNLEWARRFRAESGEG
ncbi:MAG: Stf0 sulfotransferase family protein [Actinomycetota bacterium]|nr:Stf0 sulfotransferase family protein [Actinomycetota bacterium]